jgi:hypothetical protein
MPNNDRPKVGPADPETRRKKLREVLDQPTKATGVAPKTMKDAVDAGVEQGSEKKRRKRRFGVNGKTDDEIIGEGQ